MKVRYMLAAGLIVLATQGARAEGDAGCGLGSMIIQEQTKLMQILAATTNGTAGNQTFGITSGTSNCKAQNFVMTDKAVQYFAEVNHDELSREMAQGQGEKLTTLASLYGCKGDAQKAFAQMTQASYGKIVPSAETSTTDMVKNLNAEFSSNTAVAGACQPSI